MLALLMSTGDSDHIDSSAYNGNKKTIIFLFLQRFLKSNGYTKTVLYTMVEVTYLVTFLFVRGILGTYIMMRILKSDIFDVDEKLISLVFYIVSVAFIYDIVGYVLYRYKPKIVSKLFKIIVYC